MGEKRFVTAHNVEIGFELSGLSERILAFLLDGLIMGAYVFVIVWIFMGVGLEPDKHALLYGLAVLPLLFYHLIFEITMGGQSPGKKTLNIKVIKEDGTEPTISNYLLRWILRPVDFIISGSVATLLIIITKKHQRLGDLAAGTIVVKVKQMDTFIRKHSSNLIKDDYIPTFQEAARLDPEHVELIRKAIKAYQINYNPTPVTKIASVTKDKMDVQSELPDLKFLYTVLKDHDYYNSQDLFQAEF